MVGSATMIRSSPSVTASGSQFSRLLASSRLASHSPVIPQSYTAPAAHLARGDFGLKRSLPSRNKPVGSLRYVDIEALDTREGQTIWTECEHQVLLKKRFAELNAHISHVRFDSFAGYDDSRVSLGPRISTTFDPSTRRSVPSAYNPVSDANMRTHLQSEALQGRGPVYPKNIHAGSSMSAGLDLDGPFGNRAGAYTVKVPVPVAFRAMDEKRFEKYLDYIRTQRPAYRKRSSLRAAEKERQDLFARYEKERQNIVNANTVMAESNSSTATITQPESITRAKIPLPEITGEYTSKDDDATVGIDLWNESRVVNRSLGSLWQTWLREKDGLRASQAVDTTLPSNPAPVSSKARNRPMHPSAGLQYGQPDLIQTKLLADGVPGRILSKQAAGQRNQSYAPRGKKGESNMYSVAVGGQVATMPPPDSGSSLLRSIDWSQRNPESGVMMVKSHGPTEFKYGPTVAYASSESLPIWSAQGARSNRSASAASMVAQKAVEAAESESYQDIFRQSTLPSQFGQLTMKVKPVMKRTVSRGQPGSPQWVGEIDGMLGYRAGESEEAVVDMTNMDQMSPYGADKNLSNQRQKGRYPSQYHSAKGVGEKAFSKKEIRTSRSNRREAQKPQKSAISQQSNELLRTLFINKTESQ